MRHGLYLLTENNIERFEREWLNGEQVDLITTTHTIGMDSAIGLTWEPGVSMDEKRASLQRTFGETERRLIVAYEIGDSNDNQHNYAPLADGSKDGDFRAFARDLVGLGMGDSIIAPNAEFNIGWSNRYPNDPSNYRDAWARLVREMQSVDGANFEFVLAPAPNRLGLAPDAWPPDSPFWPSDEPVPYVAPSFYEDAPQFPDDISGLSDNELASLREQAWNEHHEPNLNMWNDFATQRGATMALREWGAAHEWIHPTSNDNPQFVTDVLNYAKDNGFAFQAYWNAYATGGGSHEIYPDPDGQLIEAGNAWREFVVNDMSPTNGTDSDPVDQPSDGSDDTTSSRYNQPEPGTLNWHEPLNQNFANIETDIKELEERISKLE